MGSSYNVSHKSVLSYENALRVLLPLNGVGGSKLSLKTLETKFPLSE